MSRKEYIQLPESALDAMVSDPLTNFQQHLTDQGLNPDTPLSFAEIVRIDDPELRMNAFLGKLSSLKIFDHFPSEERLERMSLAVIAFINFFENSKTNLLGNYLAKNQQTSQYQPARMDNPFNQSYSSYQATINTLWQLQDTFIKNNGRHPTEGELYTLYENQTSSENDLSKSLELFKIAYHQGLYQQERTYLEDIYQSASALEELPEHQRVFVNETIEDKESTEVTIAQQKKIDTILSMFEESHLTKQEKEVIIFYYGLYGEDPLLMRQIAAKLGIKARQRIGQIHARAIRKLRHPQNSKKINHYREGWE